MAFNFTIYEGKTLTDLGTISAIVGKGGKIRFIPKNLRGTKRVTIVMKRKNGTSDTAICSETVSIGVRQALQDGKTKELVLATLAKLHALENDEGRQFICAPIDASGQEEEFLIDALATVQDAEYSTVIGF